MMEEDDFSYVDDGIRRAVVILNKHGFKTFESCEGGEGHCFPDPTVCFYGSEFDLMRSYDICSLYHLNVFECRRVFGKSPVYRDNELINAEPIGEAWDEPTNEIVFLKHSETGTIFRPH